MHADFARIEIVSRVNVIVTDVPHALIVDRPANCAGKILVAVFHRHLKSTHNFPYTHGLDQARLHVGKHRVRRLVLVPLILCQIAEVVSADV